MNSNTTNTGAEPLDQLMRRLEERGIQRTTQLLRCSRTKRSSDDRSFEGELRCSPRNDDRSFVGELNSTVASIPPPSSTKTIVSPTPEKAFEQMITNTVQNIPQQSILSILKEGETEFIKQTGRPMTYSEMRQMYG
jgi:hypothetical protein